ncbi:hypothetical protein WJX73_007109 [Symbiochloris irregularis]|uniref:Major facilitator superfamily (MFS) profile domain-containing protein n=1 Tax=Symbiochloris irregularis TaxID=706552 RepID=A0AAW1NIW0_9CHLO
MEAPDIKFTEEVKIAGVGSGGGEAPFTEAEKRACIRKIYWRILPFTFLLSILNYFDRANISYAAPTLKRDLHMSNSQYGLGTGILFVGYATVQIPSQLVITKVGPSTWLAVLCLCWGIVTMSQAALTSVHGFYASRFFLGLVEAGTYPGISYMMSRFLTPEEMKFSQSTITMSTALSNVFGGLLAAALLLLEGKRGLHGWQWIFLVEGAITLAYGLVVKTYYLGITSFCVYSVSYGIQYFTPLIVDSLQSHQFNGKTVTRSYTGTAYAHHTAIVALISSILFVPCAFTTVANALISMKLRHRRFCAAIPMAIAGIMFMVMPTVVDKDGFIPSYVVLIIAASMVWAAYSPINTWPQVWLARTGFAVGYGLYNTIDQFGGFASPYIVGRLSNSGGYASTMRYFGGMSFAAVAFVLVFCVPDRSRAYEEAHNATVSSVPTTKHNPHDPEKPVQVPSNNHHVI